MESIDVHLKLPSSEDTFDRAMKELQMPSISAEPQMVLHNALAQAKPCSSAHAPDKLLSSKRFYDEIFEEVMTIMREEEDNGLSPAFSEFVGSNFNQISYSQFAKDIQRASTEEIVENGDHCLLVQNHKQSLLNDQFSKSPKKLIVSSEVIANKVQNSLKLSNKVNDINNYNNKEDCLNVACNITCSKNKRAFDNKIAITDKRNRHLNSSKNREHSVCKRLRSNDMSNNRLLDSKCVKLNGVVKINKNSFNVFNKPKDFDEIEIHNKDSICLNCKCGNPSPRCEERLCNSELKVLIHTPLIKKGTSFATLERKMINFYKSPNKVPTFTVPNLINSKKIVQTFSVNTQNKPVLRSSLVDKSESGVSLNCMRSNWKGYKDNSVKHSTHNEKLVQINSSFIIDNKNTRVDVSSSSILVNDSKAMHMMYEAMQVGCIKSYGIIQDIKPSLQGDTKEDAVQFFCKSCMIAYSLKHVLSTFDDEHLVSVCPNLRPFGTCKRISAEFIFEFLVEDLKREKYTYLLVGKEAEAFFGCTLYDFWHNNNTRATVRRSVRNLLRSYERRIVSEFCLSTKNLFCHGPKYLVDVRRKTCVAPVIQ